MGLHSERGVGGSVLGTVEGGGGGGALAREAAGGAAALAQGGARARVRWGPSRGMGVCGGEEGEAMPAVLARNR